MLCNSGWQSEINIQKNSRSTFPPGTSFHRHGGSVIKTGEHFFIADSIINIIFHVWANSVNVFLLHTSVYLLRHCHTHSLCSLPF